MAGIEEVKGYLCAHGVEVLEFVESTPTSVTAAAAVGCEVGAIAKTILFVVGGCAVAVVTSGDHKVKGGKLKKATGLTGKVLLPDAEEVEAHTGYSPGGVCPFLLPKGLPVLVDSSLRRFRVVYPAAGNANSGVPIAVDKLIELVGAKECDVSDPLG